MSSNQDKCPTCGRRYPSPKSNGKLSGTQQEIVDRLKRGEKLYWRPGERPDMVRIPEPLPSTIQRMIDLELISEPDPLHDYEITVSA